MFAQINWAQCDYFNQELEKLALNGKVEQLQTHDEQLSLN